MNDINKRILDAIKDEKNSYMSPEEQENALGLIKASFKGTFKITFIFLLFLQLIFAGLAIYCAYHLLGTEAIAEKLNWLAGVIMCALAFIVARLFFFMELSRLSVIREIKRVEMQVAFLAEAISEKTKE